MSSWCQANQGACQWAEKGDGNGGGGGGDQRWGDGSWHHPLIALLVASCRGRPQAVAVVGQFGVGSPLASSPDQPARVASHRGRPLVAVVQWEVGPDTCCPLCPLIVPSVTSCRGRPDHCLSPLLSWTSPEAS